MPPPAGDIATDPLPTDLSAQVMFDNPFPMYAELRRHNPVARAYSKQMLGGAGYMLDRPTSTSSSSSSTTTSRFQRSWCRRQRRCQHRRQALVVVPHEAPAKDVPPAHPEPMVYKDDPDHARLRRLVNKAFTPRRVQELTGLKRSNASSTGFLTSRAQSRNAPVDLVTEVAVPLPLSVISSMLGVGDEDRDEFHRLMERFVVRLGSGSAADALKADPHRPQALPASCSAWPTPAPGRPRRRHDTVLLQASEDGDT